MAKVPKCTFLEVLATINLNVTAHSRMFRPYWAARSFFFFSGDYFANPRYSFV